MITKVIYSKNLSGSLRYILDPKKRAEVVLARKISSMFNVDAIIRDFERQSIRRPSCKVKAVHIPISFHVNDIDMLESNYEQILSDWVQRMEDHGYSFDQFVIGRHHDKDDKNPHFHFLGNLILDNGERAFIANIGKAAKECSISVSEKWGLTPANHKRLSVDNQHSTSTEKNASTATVAKAHAVGSDNNSVKVNTVPSNNTPDSTEGLQGVSAARSQRCWILALLCKLHMWELAAVVLTTRSITIVSKTANREIRKEGADERRKEKSGTQASQGNPVQ